MFAAFAFSANSAGSRRMNWRVIAERISRAVIERVTVYVSGNRKPSSVGAPVGTPSNSAGRVNRNS